MAIPLFFEDEEIAAVFEEWASARGWKFEGKYLVIPSTCPRLYKDGDNWLCSVESHKPKICRDYPGDDAWLPPGCAYGQ